MDYELHADESWTHSTPPLNRYWQFFGGFFGEARHVDRARSNVAYLRRAHGWAGEVKWTSLQAANFDFYKALVDSFKLEMLAGRLTFRQMFRDRYHVWLPSPDQVDLTELDGQFRLYYQFLKHSFGCRQLPRDSHIRIRLDGHSSQQHKNKLRELAEQLPRFWGRYDLQVDLTFDRSARMPVVQVADLFLGAAGCYGNKKHQLRPGGRRGMTAKQKLRLAMAKHIYKALRELDEHARGTKAFNWFETTGEGFDGDNRLTHPVRIWKFVPNRHTFDDGWLNANLDKQGLYVGTPRCLRP